MNSLLSLLKTKKPKQNCFFLIEWYLQFCCMQWKLRSVCVGGGGGGKGFYERNLKSIDKIYMKFLSSNPKLCCVR